MLHRPYHALHSINPKADLLHAKPISLIMCPLAHPSIHSTKKLVAAASKGFGTSDTPRRRPSTSPPDISKQNMPKFDDEGEAEDESGFQSRNEYQIYTDSDYRPKRFIGGVEISLGTDQAVGRHLVATSDIAPGDLVMLLTPVAFLEGSYQSAPSVEDLHSFMIEEGMPPAQRRVLDAMDPPLSSSSSPAASGSLTSLDVKFWSSRGNNDSSAPTIESKRLMRIIRDYTCTDTQPDTASSQVRRSMPLGFIGIWPELPLITHSCAPNTAITVVGDRILIHAAKEIVKGEALTRNLIGTSVTAPLPVRQMAFIEQRLGRSGGGCECKRCQAEARASESTQQALMDAYNWYSLEAIQKWNESQEKEDIELLKDLYDEADVMVGEVEEAVGQQDGFLLLDPDDKSSDKAREEEAERRKVWLRASAYDSYDMLVMADEFLNREKASTATIRACLELIRVFAPGSESHTAVAIKYESMSRARFELAEYLASEEVSKYQRKTGRRMKLSPESKVSAAVAKAAEKAQELQAIADEATELYLEAFFSRYGFLTLKQLDALKEGLEMMTEALEQASIMKSEGKTEIENNYEINGIQFKIVDKLGVIGEQEGSSEGDDLIDTFDNDGVEVKP